MQTQHEDAETTPQQEKYADTRWIIVDEYEGASSRKRMYLNSMCRWKDVDKLFLYWTRSEKRARKFYSALEAFKARREIVQNGFPHTFDELKIYPVEESD